MSMTATIHQQATHLLDTPRGVRSNKGEIDNQYIGWLRPTSKDTSIEEMRQILDEDGYLFVKGLLPRDDVVNMRRHYFGHYEPTGLVKPRSLHEDGIFNDNDDPSIHQGIGAGDLPAKEIEVQKMVESHATAEYLHFLKHPELRCFVRQLMGWDHELLLRRTMLRHNVPGGRSTGIHYDKLFLRGGDAFFLTAWVPIGDISAKGGGLIYLENSAELGRAIEDDFTERAKHFSEEERMSAFNQNMSKFGQLSDDAGVFRATKGGNRRWLVSNYEAGDVVFHDPYTLHASSKNEDPEGRIRLSTDLRFYKQGSDIDTRWMKLWTPGDGL